MIDLHPSLPAHLAKASMQMCSPSKKSRPTTALSVELEKTLVTITQQPTTATLD